MSPRRSPSCNTWMARTIAAVGLPWRGHTRSLSTDHLRSTSEAMRRLSSTGRSSISSRLCQERLTPARARACVDIADRATPPSSTLPLLAPLSSA